MTDRIDIDVEKLYGHLARLCKTPGPTQACVKVSKNDPRIKGEFPIERTVREIVEEINQELEKEGKQILQIIRHIGNLVIAGGLNNTYGKGKNEIIDFSDLYSNEEGRKLLSEIRKIPVVFGAHLDEITYVISKEIKDYEKILGDKVWKIMPICNPPENMGKDRRYQLDKNGEKVEYIIVETPRPKCKVYGFREGIFNEIGSGRLYRVYKVKEEVKIIIKNSKVIIEMPKKIEEERIENILENVKKIKEYFEVEEYLLLKCKDPLELREGDLVVQDYYVERKNTILESKALDDRVGCIAAIYAVKEMSKRGISAKAILTSSEEGVPRDVSWGRFVRATYKEFCEDNNITLLCDGMDGAKLFTINRYGESGQRKEVGFLELKGGEGLQHLKETVIIPYTSDGKGGGDSGIFSLLRDLIPKINSLYDEEIAVTSTDYSSRSYEVKIMDRWTLIGFIQWVCGLPSDEESKCHNMESIDIIQIVNIIRMLTHSAAYFHYKMNGKVNKLLP